MKEGTTITNKSVRRMLIVTWSMDQSKKNNQVMAFLSKLAINVHQEAVK